MFTTHLQRRSYSLFNRGSDRRALRSAALDGHKIFRVQRVRFTRPLFSYSRLIGIGLVTASGVGFVRWQQLEEVPKGGFKEGKTGRPWSRLIDEQDAEEKAGGSSEDVNEANIGEDDDAIMFFPTGFSRAKPRTYYKGSDPEWQEFVRIASDRAHIEKIRGNFVRLVREVAANNIQYRLRLGKIDPSKGAIWVDVRFPPGPPIEYERPGFEITEDLNFRWSTRSVAEVNRRRLSNILVPWAVAVSLYADTKEKVGRQWQGFKEYVGWEEKKFSGSNPTINAPQFPLSPPSGIRPSSRTSAPTTQTRDAESSTATDAASTSPEQPTPPFSNPAYERFGVVLPDPKTATVDLSTFRRTFRKEFKRPSWEEPPRGCFLVSGLVEVIGSRAKMTLDVTGAYNPGTGKYVALKVKIRSIVDYKQRPKGGP